MAIVGSPELAGAFRPGETLEKANLRRKLSMSGALFRRYPIGLSVPQPGARMHGYPDSGRTLMMVLATTALASDPSLVRIAAYRSNAKASRAGSERDKSQRLRRWPAVGSY